jgi:hypothetical protein
MKIKIADSNEFKRLLEVLVDELIDAKDHFRLHQALDNAIPDYHAAFNQSPVFWTMTLRAHMDATMIRLCKAYDQYAQRPSLSLRSLLKIISANLEIFETANFRERLKGSPFVDSLAAHPRMPDSGQLERDLKSVSAGDALVKNLTIWRNNCIAHRSHSSALDPTELPRDFPILFSDIKTLIDRGLGIVKSDLLFVNRNRRAFSANKLREKQLHPLLVKLCIPRGGFHSMRHGAASALLADGATPAVVQRQLRHSDPRITLGIYGHVVGNQQRDAVENRAARIA